MRIYFVRHGSTSANEQHLYCGITNNTLSVAGREQAKKAADKLNGKNIDIWLCGEMKRTRETLDIILDELVLPYDNVFILPELRELNFGKFENFSFDEVAVKFPGEAALYMSDWADFTFPDGDNTKDFFDNCACSIENIIDEYDGKDICIVAHKGYICSCLCALHDMPVSDVFSFDIGCGEVVAVDI